MRSHLIPAALAATVSASTAAAQLNLVTTYALPNASFDLQADGRLLAVDGAGFVLQQDAINGDTFFVSGSIAPINADGFNPSFVSISPDGQSVAIGNNEFNANNAVSFFTTADLTSPGTTSPTTTITTPNFSASWADNNTLFVSGAGSAGTVVNRLDTTASTSETVITPAGTFSGGVHVEGNTLFAGNGTTGDVFAFDTTTLNPPAVDIATGQFVTGSGSAGNIETLGDLLLVAGLGGVQITDRATGNAFTLAPVGTGEFYGGFFNPAANQIVVTNTAFDPMTFAPTTTAFVYNIPAPATLALAPLAALAIRRRRA
ncbi:MAG: hypothetical protein AAFO89_05905 [Planctomycetota bacterium]